MSLMRRVVTEAHEGYWDAPWVGACLDRVRDMLGSLVEHLDSLSEEGVLSNAEFLEMKKIIAQIEGSVGQWEVLREPFLV